MFSNSARYALQALAHLMLDDRPHTADELAVEAGLPRPYVAKVMTPLVRAGLVSTQRGLRGGYRLARPASTISVLDAVLAVDAGSAFDPCARTVRDTEEGCGVADLLDEVRAQAVERLRSTSLEDLRVAVAM